MDYAKDNRHLFNSTNAKTGVVSKFGERGFKFLEKHLNIMRVDLATQINAMKTQKMGQGFHALVGPACSNYGPDIVPLAGMLQIMSIISTRKHLCNSKNHIQNQDFITNHR